MNWKVGRLNVEENGKDYFIDVCYCKDEKKGGLWVKMKFKGDNGNYIFKGKLDYDGKEK
jgi:hypothetical protein